jgi:arylsulfatase A-like enzyme
MVRINHLKIAFILSISLSALTVIAVTATNYWSIRNFYLLIYYFFLSLSLLSLNTLLFSRKRKFIPNRLRKPLRIAFITVYSFIYIASTISYVTTGQIVRAQTLIFITGASPLKTNLISLGIVLVIFLTFLALVHRKTNFKDSKRKDSKKIKITFYVSFVFFIITLFVNPLFLQIENSIVTDKDKLLEYQAEEPLLEEVSNISQSFDRPNVVFILLESLSAERLGTYGYERDVSPNIDSLAKDSVVFTRAYTTSTHSDYSQPGLLSSRYLFTSDIRNNFDQKNPRKFIWDIFKEDNYSTGYFSSQDDRWQGMNKYLDFKNIDTYSYSLTDGSTDYGSRLAKKDYDHRTSEKAINWLNETIKDEKPLFLYLNFQATHNPNAYPEEYSHFKPDDGVSNPLAAEYAQKEVNRYDNALRYVDEQVGKIISFIEENDLKNDTIIVITADHGHDLEGRHGFRGHAQSIYEEELIVPAIVFLPGVAPTVVNGRVSHIDFVPTLIDLLGYTIPPEFQGDLMRKNRPIFFVTQSHKYKIGLIQNNSKVIIDLNKELIEAYDLENDPGELNQLKPKEFNKQILKLLFWRHCQISYYENEKWKTNVIDRCSAHNNLKPLGESTDFSPLDFFKKTS